ncbi:hypothetical protein Vafri_16850 [Volvox africanus]|uniref:C-CAP/cofactor C-like domain-containing protein n=1 Tax=Volvox africanus TaxID=51714 RepID=A0A8J4F6X1_9CHLO|nr:hypothetical protein Vafri_16850 [Volvox africanus]
MSSRFLAILRIWRWRSGKVEPSSVSISAGVTNVPESRAKPSESSSLMEWDRLLAEHMSTMKILSQHIPQEAQKSMESFERAFLATRRVLEISLLAKKPESPAELQSLLAPVSEAMGAVTEAAEGGRSCQNHLKVLSEAVGALGFLACGPGSGCSPRQHVLDCWQSAEFFANKLLMEFRGKDEDQVAWVKGLKALVQTQLEQFVLRNCPTGLRFNPDGVTLAAAMIDTAAATSAPSAQAQAPAVAAPKPASQLLGAPPPPPPGPPPKPLSADELGVERVKAGGGGGGGMSAIFKELSTGEGITRKLRHVTSMMKSTHNTDRTGCVPAAPAAPTAIAVKKGQPSGSPSLELKGTKWMVENFSGRQDLVVENTTPKQSVYVYGCTDCVVQIQGKVNTISLDNCKRLGVVFSDVIASIEAVNCSSVQLQTTGTVPTITVEKTDGAQLYLSQACAANPNFQIVSAKSSSINVIVVPSEDDPSDPQEQPIPEQYISTFKRGRLVTVAAEHSGA